LVSKELHGLSIAASKELLALRAGQQAPPSAAYADWCVTVAEGHPLYLRELGDGWRSRGESYRIPPSLLSLLTARIDNLRPAALRAVQFCALLGRDSTLRRLEDLLGLRSAQFSDVIEELERADVATSQGDHFVVRHELLAEAALDRTLAGTRKTLHKRLAILFEAELPLARSAALSWRCAEHWLLAGEPGRAGSAVEASASRLTGIGLPGEAASLLRTYLDGELAPHDRARVLRLYLAAQRYMGHWSMVLSTALAETSLAYVGISKHDATELHVREAAWRGEQTSLHELLASAEACASDVCADREHRIQSAIQAEIFAADLLDRDALRRIYAAACRNFPYHPDADLSTTRLHLVFHSVEGDLDFAVELARHSIAIAEKCGNPVTLGLCLRNSLIPLRYGGRLHEAVQNGLRAFDLALTSQIPDAIASAASTLALSLLASGAYDDAQRYAHRAVACLPDLEPQNGRSHFVTAAVTVAFHRGDFAEAASWVPQLPLPIEHVTTMYSLDTQAMHTIEAVVHNRTEEVTNSVNELIRSFQRAAPTGAQDTNACIAVYCLLYLDQVNQALSFLRSYLQTRRERYSLAPLLGWLSNCRNGAELLELARGMATEPHPRSVQHSDSSRPVESLNSLDYAK
jgi:hypothetical protein